MVPMVHSVSLNQQRSEVFIVRQLGDLKLQFIFPPDPESSTSPNNSVVAFTTILGNVQGGISSLNTCFQQDKVLLLVEPMEMLMEPKIVGIQTILTCSPDRKHYKEFVKLAARKLYMPVWTLDELQLAGAHIRYHTSDEFLKNALEMKEIEKRFYRFGGILRHVIPAEEGVQEAENLLEQALDSARPVDTFIRGRSIEKMDNQKDNISHFLLQYDVLHDGSFQHFQMMYASEYVRKHIKEKQPSKLELQAAVHQLIRMFQEILPQRPDLFEFVVYYGLKEFEWAVYCKKEEMWKDRKFDFVDSKSLSKPEEVVLEKMKNSVLCRPLHPNFPAVDMLWVEVNEGQKEYFAVQVTFASSHAKSPETYQGLRERIGLKPEDKLTIYMVTNPRHLTTYAKCSNESFISGATRRGVSIEFATITTKKFDYPFVKNIPK